jgi:hypothetical protein
MTASDKLQNLRQIDIREKYSVEMLTFRTIDMTDLKTFLSPGKYGELTEDDILDIKLEDTTRRQWQTTRRRVVYEFARERSGDPSMTAKKWNDAKNMKRTRECDWK